MSRRSTQGVIATESDPADTVVAVTASDSTDLPGGTCRGLLVGTAGAAKITDGVGNVVNAVPLQAGYNPLRVTRIWATGIVAANIFALY